MCEEVKGQVKFDPQYQVQKSQLFHPSVRFRPRAKRPPSRRRGPPTSSTASRPRESSECSTIKEEDFQLDLSVLSESKDPKKKKKKSLQRKLDPDPLDSGSSKRLKASSKSVLKSARNDETEPKVGPKQSAVDSGSAKRTKLTPKCDLKSGEHGLVEQDWKAKPIRTYQSALKKKEPKQSFQNNVAVDKPSPNTLIPIVPGQLILIKSFERSPGTTVIRVSKPVEKEFKFVAVQDVAKNVEEAEETPGQDIFEDKDFENLRFDPESAEDCLRFLRELNASPEIF